MSILYAKLIHNSPQPRYTEYMQEFSYWLNEELNQRGWSRSEAARRGEISPSMLDKVISGGANPGLEFCKAIARAFKMPPEIVLRKAGLLSMTTEDKATEEELLDYFRALSPHTQRLIVAQARAAYEINSEEK